MLKVVCFRDHEPVKDDNIKELDAYADDQKSYQELPIGKTISDTVNSRKNKYPKHSEQDQSEQYLTDDSFRCQGDRFDARSQALLNILREKVCH